MKFFNRLLLLYSLIVVICTLSYYYVSRNFSWGIWPVLIYFVTIFGSAFIISQRDEHQRYAGFNYHFITYAIVNGLPALLLLGNIWLPKATENTFLQDINSVAFWSAQLSIMLVWGIGVLAHFLMYLFIFRKQAIGSYSKDDVFK